MALELEYKTDADRARERMEAWWVGEILDRPAIQVTAPKGPVLPWPESRHASLRERWMDVEYQVACGAAAAANIYWAGESLPVVWPNLGPEILTAAFGAELEFGEDTSWSVPILDDWADLPDLALDPDNPYVRAILDMTRRALEVGRGKFVVGLTDLHPGADLAASLRDPQQLCIDLVAEPARVHDLMDRLRPSFYAFYELQRAVLLDAGQTLTTSWLPLFTEGRYYIPSCDFACMVSPAMFREFFLSEIREEVEWLGRSIYHLDGPNALLCLDDLLEIEKLDAVQYVWGAGKGLASDWISVFQRIQAAGKNLHISILPGEIDVLMEALRPEGVMLQAGCASVEEADQLVARVSHWRSHAKAVRK